LVAYLSASRIPQHGIIQDVNIMNKITLDLNTSVERGSSCSECGNKATKLRIAWALPSVFFCTDATYNELVKLGDLTDPTAANILHTSGICKECGTIQRYRPSFDDVRSSVNSIPLLLQKFCHREQRDLEVLP
jgi:hypothetical protein